MKDFKDFMMAVDESEVDEEELSDMMWEFISSLDDTALDSLNEDQQEAYVEIIEAIAGDEDDDEETDEALESAMVEKKEPGIEVDYAQGMSSKRKRKKFKTQAAYEKWFDKNEDDIEVFATRDLEEGEELDELLPAKRVRRDIQQKKKASREHRKVKAKRKIEGRRKRKTAKFKRFKKKSKRMAKRGLTSRGSRKRSFINKG